MDSAVRMNGVVNETTNTIHKQETGKAPLESVCGATYNLPERALRPARITSATEETTLTRCGRCFEDGGGY